jgi:hypothetical protein
MKTYYLHTIENHPAHFSKSDKQIVYAEDNTWRDKQPPQYLRKSVKQILADQALTRKNRESWGFKDDAGKYGYVKVVIPA